MRSVSNTFAAIYASFRVDNGVSALDPYRLGRAMSDTGGTAGAFTLVKKNRMLVRIHIIILSETEQSVKYVINVVKVVKLTVECGRGQGNLPLKAIHIGKLVAYRLLGIVRAMSDTFSAVNALA
jgi:hypothetical protein